MKNPLSGRTALPSRLARLSARLRERWIFSLVGVVALAAAAVVGTAVLIGGDGAAASSSVDFEQQKVVNQAGGYRLAVPADWQVTKKNTSTQLIGPNNNAIVTVGIGPKGRLPSVSAEFFAQVGSRYDAVETLGVKARQIGGAPARVWAAIGTNDRGDRVRFSVITIQHGSINYVITVRAGANSDPEQILPRVSSIVASLEPTRG